MSPPIRKGTNDPESKVAASMVPAAACLFRDLRITIHAGILGSQDETNLLGAILKRHNGDIMKKIIAVLALLASAVILLGQDKPEPTKTEPAKTTPAPAASTKNPVSDTVREILARQKNNLLGAVEEMPADKFGYSPTPAQMTFGHLVIHTAMSNIELCSKAGSMPPPPMKLMPETDKVRLQAGLTRSFMYCEAALGRIDDSKLGNPIEF